MKTIFTFMLMLFLSMSYAQKTDIVNTKSAALISGIATENQLFSISKVYPNPVKDFVTLDIKSTMSGAIQISIYNILGIEVKKWESFSLTEGNQDFKIDLSSVKTGIYILKITGSNQVCTQVLKKN